MSFANNFSDNKGLALIAFFAVAVAGFLSPISSERTLAQESPLGGRAITVVSTTAEPGSTVNVSVVLDAQGDEVSTSFSIVFDSAVLSNPVVTLGSGVPMGTNLSVNLMQAASGRIGVLVDSTSPYLISPPDREIIKIAFNVAASAPAGPTAITFSNTPTPLSTSSAIGALLPTAYEVGIVTIDQGEVQLVTVGGRVTTPGGQNLRNATVNMIDSMGVRRIATTSSFGIYSFNDVATGQQYTFTVSSKRYRFSPQIVPVTQAISDLNFVGLE